MKKSIKKLSIYFTTGFIFLLGINKIRLCRDESKLFTEKVFIYTNTFDDDDFKIAAHRGFSSLEIENTKEAISLADKKKYIDYIEVDLRLTKDNHIVLSHNNTLLTTDGSTYKISNRNYDFLKDLDFCYFPKITTINSDINSDIELTRNKKINNKNFKITTLQECLNCCDDKKIILDLKLDENKDSFIEELDKELVDCDTSNLLFQSNNLEYLKEFKSSHPNYSVLGIIKNNYDLDYIDCFDSLCIKKDLITQDLIDKIIDNKENIAIWTLNFPKDIDRIVDQLGDNYKNIIYITDYPDVVATCLHEKELVKEKEKTTN